MAGKKRDFNASAATWDDNPRRVKTANDVARAIRETVRLRPDMDLLDFGCGTGLLTLNLLPYVRTITGIDNSQGMLDVLNAKIRTQDLGNVRTRLVDLEHDDLLDGQFDLVISNMTFHHIRDIRSLLDQLAGVLKPSGQLTIADLDSDGGKFHDSDEGVFHAGFDRSVMKNHFEATGFESVRNRTAAIVQKSSPYGEMRTFTVFLMTGLKRVAFPLSEQDVGLRC